VKELDAIGADREATEFVKGIDERFAERAPGGKGGPSVDISNPALGLKAGGGGGGGATFCNGLGITRTFGLSNSTVE